MTEQANHFVVTGAGIDGVVDTDGLDGNFIVSVSVDGRELRTAALVHDRQGIVVSAIHEEVPDSHTIVVTLVLPEVDADAEPVVAAGYAVLTRQQQPFRGPRYLPGPVNTYELRPLAVTASVVES